MVPTIALTLDTICKFGGLAKTTVRFDAVLEGPTEPTETCSTCGYGLLQSTDTEGNHSKEETRRAESGNVPNAKLPLSSLSRESGCFTFPLLVCDNMHCQPEKLILVFIGASLCRHD